jgi:hypothetical protein
MTGCQQEQNWFIIKKKKKKQKINCQQSNDFLITFTSELGLWGLTALSTIFQLYCGDNNFYIRFNCWSSTKSHIRSLTNGKNGDLIVVLQLRVTLGL